MCQMMAQMTMIVTQHLHHAGTYRQFWTEHQMVLTSMLHLVLSPWISFRITCGLSVSFTTPRGGRAPPAVGSTVV